MADRIREHRSLLAASEKRLLIWVAHRLPRVVHSDHLTALALAAMALAGFGFAVAGHDRRGLWVVVCALLLNWFGDSLDGTLARVRRLERPRYGFYLDHVVDILGVTMLMAGLGASGFMTPVIALGVLVAYLLVSSEVFLATSVHGTFRMSFAGVGPTELRILLAAGAVALFRDPHVELGVLGRWRLFDVGGVTSVAGLAIALSFGIARNLQMLAALEPRRAPAPASREAPVAGELSPRLERTT